MEIEIFFKADLKTSLEAQTQSIPYTQASYERRKRAKVVGAVLTID